MSEENVESLRAFLETWSREAWTLHRVRSKARHTGIEFDTALAYLWTFQDGKVIHFKSFLDPEQTLEAGGLHE